MKKPHYSFFGINEIKPEGWLKRQLRIQADGLSGTLPNFWPDISDSAWIGGTADSWERVPYWLDGFIVLAWQLDDEELKATARKYIDAIIANQADDGWICPDVERTSYDMWGYILILKTLSVYHDVSGDESVVAVIERALKYLDKHINGHINGGGTLSEWGQMRWFEALIPIYLVYERIGEDWLRKLAVKLKAQGFDWKALFEDGYSYEQPQGFHNWSHMNHVVNNAMMLKGYALYYLFSNNPSDLEFARTAYDKLMEHHGMVTGVFTGDECLSGLNPFQGTELCAVAELMYSLEHLAAITGDGSWADIWERVTFNAFPATFSPDMTSHQYVQQVNQPFCVFEPTPHFNTNNSEANMFGVEPHFGCCAANMHQGFPKFAAALYLYEESTIVVNGYAPSRLETQRFGELLNLRQETDYPFEDTIKFTVKCESPTTFAILLRIPSWAKDFACSLDGEQVGGYYKISREWSGEMSFTLKLPMEAKLENRPNNTVALTRGPLVYSLEVGYEMKKYPKPGEPWWMENNEVHPTSRWQYVMSIDDVFALKFEKSNIAEVGFTPETAGISVQVPCCKVDWNVNDMLPEISPNLATAASETELVKFVPYGCTMLRMTELPNV